MKKILFMLTSMNIGGVEKSLLSLVDKIPKYEYEITILLLKKEGGFLKYIPNHIKVEEVKWYDQIKPIIMKSPYDIINNYLRKKQYLKMIKFLICYYIDKYFDNRYIFYKNVMNEVPVNSENYDIAISYQGPTDIIDYYIANKVKADKKISWVHFDVSKHSLNQKLYKKLYSSYNKIFIVSKEARNQLINKIPEVKAKTEVFYNIISKELIYEMAMENIDFDDDYKGIKIVTVGRLSKEKGQDLAIEVLRKLKRRGYDVRWYCVGEGNDRDYFGKIIKKYNLQNDFILLGVKVNPYPYINKADIYVQTSRHEGYCLTLAEAKCLKKPIVTTNFIGAYEQITNEYNGLISDCNEDELYENIKILIDDRYKRDVFVNNLQNEELNTTEEVNKLFDYIR